MTVIPAKSAKKLQKSTVKTAKIYCIYGELTDEDIAAIKKYVINPVEAREAALELPETLKVDYTELVRIKRIHGEEE